LDLYPILFSLCLRISVVDRCSEGGVLKVGLTGGIASGKSVVAEMFAGLGAHVIQADEIAHRLMQPGEPVYREVVQRFGTGILGPDGSVNRAKLAHVAFGNPPRVDELNRIVHPAVVEEQDRWMNEVGDENPHAIAMVEAALILEAGARSRFDRLVVVTCEPEQRVERWAKRVRADLETARREVNRRMAAQWPESEKIKASDYVIDNSGSLDETRQQVQKVFKCLEEKALENRELRTEN
jgi:dephospho-CoA kinase